MTQDYGSFTLPVFPSKIETEARKVNRILIVCGVDDTIWRLGTARRRKWLICRRAPTPIASTLHRYLVRSSAVVTDRTRLDIVLG